MNVDEPVSLVRRERTGFWGFRYALMAEHYTSLGKIRENGSLAAMEKNKKPPSNAVKFSNR